MVLDNSKINGDTIDATTEYNIIATQINNITDNGLDNELTFNSTTIAGLNLNSLTTTERNALTPTTGMVIWNETDTQLQIYNGSGWVAFLINLVDDTTPQLGASLDLNNFGCTREETAAVSLVAGDFCYMNASGKFDKADASVEATCDTVLLLCLDTISADAVGTFLEFGEYTTTGLTAGSNYYVSETAGAITATAPSTSLSIVRIVGTALSTTVLKFKPDTTYVEVA